MSRFIFLLLISVAAHAQQTEGIFNKWNIRSGLYMASENNNGDPGLSLKSEFSNQINKSLDVSFIVGGFHSLPEWNKEPVYYTGFSSLFGGLTLNHKMVFGNNNFVRTSAGLIFVNWNSVSITENLANGVIYYRPRHDEQNNIGYILGLEGGREVSDKLGVGLQLSILSYQIFGDIFMLGLNFHIRL